VALNVIGVPILLVRNSDGQVRAFINACRHRGARLCEDGKGTKRVFACPYHAWTYDHNGALIGRYGAKTFGDIDSEEFGLSTIACAESAGLVWITLKPKSILDIEAWLGSFKCEIESLRLGEWMVYDQRNIPGPGWKVTMDGDLEAYHHDSVHGKTVGQHTIGNLVVHDSFGPHQRLTFGRKSLATLDSEKTDSWGPDEHIRIIYSGFPNLSISGILGGYCLVSQVFPGAEPDNTVTRQTVLIFPNSDGSYDHDAAESFSQMTLQAVSNEDYPIGFGIQSTVTTNANSHFIFGRNEIGLQHYHSWVEKFMSSQDE
jgi:phenylpropionate dioxygenase-like ring-hydroxylating dioxygenase large terminal subunit